MHCISLLRHSNKFFISSSYGKPAPNISISAKTYADEIEKNISSSPPRDINHHYESTIMNQMCKLPHGLSSSHLYVYTEIFQAILFNQFLKPCKTLLFTMHNEGLINCIKQIKQDSAEDIYYNFDLKVKNFTRNEIYAFNKLKKIYENTIDLLVFDLSDIFNKCTYSKTLISIVCNIIDYQKHSGSCIIKMGDLHQKPVLDIIYILNYFYKKLVIMSPTINSSDKYLVCVEYCSADYSKYLAELEIILRESPSEELSAILSTDLPMLFLNKIDDFNITTCSSRLNTNDQISSLYMSKQSLEKIEEYKKNTLIRCSQWFSKHKIPHHKHPFETDNIFLFNPEKTLVSHENIFLTAK